MDSLKTVAKAAAVVGLASIVYSKASTAMAEEHSFEPSAAVPARKDRFKVLNAQPGEPLKAPLAEFFLNKDGLYIHFRRWIPVANIHPLPPKGIVIICHGLGEYSSRYDHVARALNAAGFVVYGLDHQGHGRSEGDRLHIQKIDDYVDDVIALLKIAKKEHPLIEKKAFLLGHSMGGLISVLTLGRYQSEFAGAVISGPALELSEPPAAPLLAILKVLSATFPRLPVEKLSIQTLVKFAPTRDLYLNDPLVHKGQLPARLTNELVGAIDKAAEIARTITLPYLLFHGESDKLCPISGSEKFHASTKSSDKKFERIDGMHETLNENNPEVINLVVNWLKSHL